MKINTRNKSVRCWRCGAKFPEGTRSRKVGEAHYVDRYEHLRSHWQEKHERSFQSEKA